MSKQQMRRHRKGEPKRTVGVLAPLLSMGVAIAFLFISSTAVGWWLDVRWEAQGRLILLGMFLGLGAAAGYVWHTIRLIERKEHSKHD